MTFTLVKVFSYTFYIMRRLNEIAKQSSMFEIDDSSAEVSLITPDLSPRRRRRIDGAIEAITRRNQAEQDVGFASRPFVLCNLPVRKPKSTIYVRTNGRFELRIECAEDKILPHGQDRLLLIYMATLAVQQKQRKINLGSAREILSLFGKDDSGKNYQRLMEGFERIFSSTITWKVEGHERGARFVDKARMLMVDRLKLWYEEEADGPANKGYENEVTLSEPFFAEVTEHPIPVDMTVIRSLKDSPSDLDFYLWISWRAWNVRIGSTVEIPLFGRSGIQSQLGSEIASDRKFRQCVKKWVANTRAYWTEAPVKLSEDGNYLVLEHGKAVLPHLTSGNPRTYPVF